MRTIENLQAEITISKSNLQHSKSTNITLHSELMEAFEENQKLTNIINLKQKDLEDAVSKLQAINQISDNIYPNNEPGEY
jgi:hypothetical protein